MYAQLAHTDIQKDKQESKAVMLLLLLLRGGRIILPGPPGILASEHGHIILVTMGEV